VRIIAGRFRGRRLKAPAGDGTRPTTDRVREALFSALVSLRGPDLGGGSALDPFAGSGALGFEALSRGCASVTFVESGRAAQAVLRHNVDVLGVDSEAKIVAADALRTAGRVLPGRPFSLILLDPPYTLDQTAVAGLLVALADAGSVSNGAVVTWEHASSSELAWPEGFSPLQSRAYGSTTVDVAIYEGSDGSQ
jgi:16S rRNA (guanine966-N2)-methyltransferase